MTRRLATEDCRACFSSDCDCECATCVAARSRNGERTPAQLLGDNLADALMNGGDTSTTPVDLIQPTDITEVKR